MTDLEYENRALFRFCQKFKKATEPLEGFEHLGECWEWTAGTLPTGEGMFSYRNRVVPAHRFLYEQLVGEIPEGMDLNRECFNRACVRPGHMELRSRSQRGIRRSPGLRGKSQYPGISITRSGSFQAQKMHKGKLHYLGVYRFESEAKAAYDRFVASLA